MKLQKMVGYYNFLNSPYMYDFAWSDIKLDAETDGRQHSSRKAKKSDARRDEWSNSLGWTVLRFRSERIYNDLETVINEIKIKISELRSKI
jgi:very-short-patch-repair endonuclease